MIKSKNSNNLKTERRQVIFLPFKKCLNINIFSATLKDQSSNLITRKIALGKIETKKKKKKKIKFLRHLGSGTGVNRDTPNVQTPHICRQATKTKHPSRKARKGRNVKSSPNPQQWR